LHWILSRRVSSVFKRQPGPNIPCNFFTRVMNARTDLFGLLAAR
jgi:hypothetical protein